MHIYAYLCTFMQKIKNRIFRKKSNFSEFFWPTSSGGLRGRPWGTRLYLRQHVGKALESRGMPSKGPGLCTWHMQLYQRFYAGKDLAPHSAVSPQFRCIQLLLLVPNELRHRSRRRFFVAIICSQPALSLQCRCILLLLVVPALLGHCNPHAAVTVATL